MRKKGRCHPQVAAWQAAIAHDEVFVSAVTMTEIRQGILAARRNKPQFAEALEEWYEQQVKPSFGNRILPVDLAVAERAAQLLAERSRSFADCLIAATAHAHGLVLATRNESDFADTGIQLLNPWVEASH